MKGRVEICFNGMCGTVCDDQFNNMAAQVVCTQLNHTSAGDFLQALVIPKLIITSSKLL